MPDDIRHLDPDAIFLKLEEASDARCEAMYLAERLEAFGDILKAKLMVAAKDKGTAIGICKEVALTDPQWETHIEGVTVARQRMMRTKDRYDNLRVLAELRRTEESTRRALAR